MEIAESQLRHFRDLLEQVAGIEAASVRVKLESQFIAQRIDALHGLLCSDHFPPSQHGQSDPLFDFSQNTGRRL